MKVEPSNERRLWWQIFGLLLLAGTMWAVAVPPMTGPDESSNAVRAAAVVRGQWTGNPKAELNGNPSFANVMVGVEVPESFADADEVGGCFTGVPREVFFGAIPIPRGAECPELTESERPVPAVTYEYRGQPFFYLLVGLPTLLSVGETGAFGMRLVGLLMCSALLASALVSVRRLRGRSLVMLGAIVALSPEVLYLASVQNPAGLEIASALGLWAAGLALATSVDDPDRRIVTRFGIALLVLVLTRGMSPVFAAVALAVLALVARPGRVRHLLGRVDVRAWGAAAAAAVAVSAAWLLYIHEKFPLDYAGLKAVGFANYPPTGFDQAWDRIPFWTQGMVGVFGSTDVVPPMIVHWAWIAGAAAVVALAVARGSRRHTLLAVGLVVLGIGLLISGEGFAVPQIGFWWQGRYVLPVVVGALLLAPAGIQEARADGEGLGDDAAVGAPGETDDGDGDTVAIGAPGVADDGDGDDGDVADGVLEVSGDGRSDPTEPSSPVMPTLAWPALATVFVVGHVWCFAYAMRHYTVGHDGSANPVNFLFDPIWSPPLHPALLLVMFTVAVGALAAILWRASLDDGATGARWPRVDYRPASDLARRRDDDRPARRPARIHHL